MQTFHQCNKSSNISGTRGEEKEVLSTTSRKVLGAGTQVCTEPVEGVQRGPSLTSRSLHIRCGPGVRKRRQAPSETAGSGRKSRPTSRLPCSSEAGECPGPSLESSLQTRAPVKAGCQPLPSRGHLAGRTYTSSERGQGDAPQHRPFGHVPCTSEAPAVRAV